MGLGQDVIHALRQVRHKPALPLIIIFTLGAAMGVGTSAFSLFNATWLTPWAVPDPGRVRVTSVRVTADEWRAWPRQTASFAGLAADGGVTFALLGRQGVRPRFVSANAFAVLRIPMASGPGLDAGDDRAAVISHQFWQRHLGGDPAIVGRTIVLDRAARNAPPVTLTIAGIAADGFNGTDIVADEIWLPLAASRYFDLPADQRLMVFARLADAVSDERATAELAVLGRRYSQDAEAARAAAPELRRTDRYSIMPPSTATSLRWASMIAGIIFITLLSCANVSNLLLARGYSRRAEIAVRMALGSSRAGIVRQLLIESLILAVAAGGVGMAIASWLPDALLREFIDMAGVQIQFGVDRRMFAWSMVVSLVACVAFGLAPALMSTDLTIGEGLKEGHQNARRGLMPGLLGYQTIVSVMAIVIAGLMLRSDPVVQARTITSAVGGLAILRLDPPAGFEPARAAALVAAMTDRLTALGGGRGTAGMQEAQMLAGAAQSIHVTPSYFDTFRLPWVAGRVFTAAETAAAVMVVNTAFVQRFWPDRNPIGQVLTASDGRVWDRTLLGRTVVGVVENAQRSSPIAYLPVGSGDVRVFFVRAPVAEVTRVARDATAQAVQPVAIEVMTGDAWLSPVVGPLLLATRMTTGFGGVALLLGLVGFFSLLEYTVQQRTREIGIRRAFGAGSWDVIRALIVPAAWPLFRGLIVGSTGAAALALFMRRAAIPAGINPADVVIYVAVAALLTVAAVVASLAPARHALRVEPMKALRVD